MHRIPAALFTAIVLSVQLTGPPRAEAQLAPPPVFEGCGRVAKQVGRFAARAEHWQVKLPVVKPVAQLGAGVLFLATANPACCEPLKGCSGSSERPDALIGAVGNRLFALTADAPHGAPRLPWQAKQWSDFIAATAQGPRTAEEAVALVWLVFASVRPGLGLVRDAAALDTLSATRGASELSGARAALQRSGLAPLRSAATPSGGGYDVTLWASHYAPATVKLRESPAGLSSDGTLLRVLARSEPSGRVILLSMESLAALTNTHLPADNAPRPPSE